MIFTYESSIEGNVITVTWKNQDGEALCTGSRTVEGKPDEVQSYIPFFAADLRNANAELFIIQDEIEGVEHGIIE